MNRIERMLRSWMGAALLAGALTAPAFVAPATATAQVANVINVQGRLLSQAGTAVPDGTYGMTVSFYKGEKDAKAVFVYVSPGVTVKGGIFHLAVGEKTPLDSKVFKSMEAAWVGIQVGAEAELPRLALYKVPYAIAADSAGALSCTNCITQSHLNATFAATLAKKGELTAYAKKASLAKVATSGSFKDLKDVPAAVATNQTCPAGETMVGITNDGKIGCAKDKVNTYDGKNFGLSNQKCAAGTVVGGLDAAGKVVCVKDQKGAVTGADFALSNQACGTGFVAKGINKSGKLICAKDTDNDTKYTGKNFALSNQGCGTGLVMKAVGVDGKAVCVKDANTTYTGKNFVPSNQKCASNRYVAGFTSTGAPICVLDQKGQSSGKDFALSNQKCLSGQVVAGVDVSGKVVCEIKGQVKGTPYALSNQTCPTGFFVKNIASTGKVVCVKDANTVYSGKNFALANKKCAAAQIQVGVSTTGNPLCVTDTTLKMDWTYGWSKRVAASGKWISSLGWGAPMITPKDCAYSDVKGVSTTNANTVEFPIPTGAKTAYVSILQWSDGGYFDIWLRYGSTWKWHRRVNSYQNASTATAGTHSGNQIVLAATGLTGYSRVRIQGRKGRIYFTGMGFSRADHRAESGNSYVHWDSLLNKPPMYANALTSSQVKNLAAAKLADGSTPWTDGKKHNHTYDVNDAWLRDNGDDAHFKVYGNKRTVVMRTDGTGAYGSNGNYPFIWLYGGDSVSNRKMLMNTNGEIWTATYGWLHEKFAPISGGSNYVQRKGDSMTGSLSFGSTSINQGTPYALRATSKNGYVQIGARSTAYGYIETDRPSFYLNKELRVDTGKISSYNESLSLGVSGSTKVTINSKGHVGVGDTTPDYPLDVETAVTGWQVRFTNGNDSVYLNGSSGDGMLIQTGAKDATSTTLLRAANASGQGLLVRGDRRVGIRTSAPAAVLDLNGNAYLRSHVGIATAPRTDSYKLAMGGNIYLGNNQLNHAAQVHFNNNVRFYQDNNDNYLNFKYGDSKQGGIKFLDGDDTRQGFLYSDGDASKPSFGLLDGDGTWAVRVHKDTAVEFRVNNTVEATVKSDGLYVTNKIVSGKSQVQRDVWQFSTTLNGARYLHIKTNIRPTTSSRMYNFEFRGYNYGRNAIINSQIAGYAYAANKRIEKATYANYSSGVTCAGKASDGKAAAGQYVSADGYLVVRIYASNWYFAGFSMSAWMTSPAGKGFLVAVTSSKLVTSSGKQF